MSEAHLNENSTISDEAIAQRAYEIWESKGCPDGDGSDNWEAAKAELFTLVEHAPIATEHTSSRRGPLLRWFDRLRNRAAL